MSLTFKEVDGKLYQVVYQGEAALFACRDRDVLRAFLQEQLSAWDAVGLQALQRCLVQCTFCALVKQLKKCVV